MAKTKIILAEQGPSNDKRYGCFFTTEDLDKACKTTGLGRTEMEKRLKTAFGQAKAGGATVKVYGNVSLKKGSRGQTANLIFGS